MTWGDNLNISENNDSNINWKNRYKYVRDNIDDLGYMLSNVSRSKKVGQTYVSVCPFPFHAEKTASFTIYPAGYIDKNGEPQNYSSFYCFGCGSGGDAIKFKQLLDGLSSKKEASILLEKENSIDVNNEDVRQLILKESLDDLKNASIQYLDFNKTNLICSNICRDYLGWIRNNFPEKINEEFKIIQKYYKHFDDEIGEYSLSEIEELICKTQNIISERKNYILKSNI